MEKRVIKIDKKTVKEYNRFLRHGKIYPADGRGAIETWTADFGDGYAVDISVCADADSRLYIDYGLVKNGSGVTFGCEPVDQLDGEYWFWVGNKEYVVEVVAA